MTDADAPFLRSIRPAPDDLLPQGLYLNWLSEQPGRWGDWLLRRVLLDPGDDGVRLEYARHLEETSGSVACPECCGHGELVAWCEIVKENDREVCPACRGSGSVSDDRRERAEFIRVQCELASAPAPTGCRTLRGQGEGCFPDEHCPWCVLRRRERELLNRYGYQWAGPAAEWIGPPRDWPGRYHRGFVASLTLTAADLLAHAAAVFGAAPVTSVVLNNKEPHEYHNNGGSPLWAWYRGRFYANHDWSSDLPEQLWEFVAEQEGCEVHGPWADFPTQSRATAAISAGAVAFGRSAAGLPAWGPARQVGTPVG